MFFNRGVASSQAYARKFGNKRPTTAPPGKQKEATEWLSREPRRSHPAFIADAERGNTLLCCFYEFRYRPVADALKAAIGRGVEVRHHSSTARKNCAGDERFPAQDNLEMIEARQIPKAT